MDRRALKVLAPEIAPDAKVIAVDFGAKAAPNLDVVEAEVTETSISIHRAPTRRPIHLELSFDGAAPAYKPGDSLDLFAENDPAYVDALLKAAGLAPMQRCARSSSRAATSPRCRLIRSRPMRLRPGISM